MTRDEIDAAAVPDPTGPADLLSPLLDGPARSLTSTGSPAAGHPSVVIGELLAIADGGLTPMVVYPGQRGTGALAARTTVDLDGGHVGRAVTIVFDQGDPGRPIVTGVLRAQGSWPTWPRPREVELDVDGNTLVVDAGRRLVLRCGEASIVLTHDGKVVIRGTCVVTHATGLNRIRGGAVQIN